MPTFANGWLLTQKSRYKKLARSQTLEHPFLEFFGTLLWASMAVYHKVLWMTWHPWLRRYGVALHLTILPKHEGDRLASAMAVVQGGMSTFSFRHVARC